MELIKHLGYEQLKALKILAGAPDVEGSALCSQADCSWNELLSLARDGLIDLGSERIAPKQLNPVLTELGHEAVKQIFAAGLFQPISPQ